MKQTSQQSHESEKARASPIAGVDRDGLFSTLTALNQQGIAQLSAATVALERCRLAAEWKQAVEEQGLLITAQIKSSMRELFAKIKMADQKYWYSPSHGLDLKDMTDAELFELHRLELIKDVEYLVQAHVDLGDSMIRMAALLVEVESCSARVANASDRISANGLVLSREIFKSS